MTAVGFMALLDAAQSSEQLEVIDCCDAWLSFEAAEMLAAHPSLRNVTSLNMCSNSFIGDVGVELLKNSFYITAEARRCLEDDYDEIFE